MATMRQERSCLAQSDIAPAIAACSLAAFSVRPTVPLLPVATALQPTPLPRRRARSSRNSGAMMLVPAGRKKPTTFIVIGIGTTKSLSTATTRHGTPAFLPQSSSTRRIASSELFIWAHFHLVSVNRRRNILDVLLADIGEVNRELVRHLFVNRA